jgi:hypothetical protein
VRKLSGGREGNFFLKYWDAGDPFSVSIGISPGPSSGGSLLQDFHGRGWWVTGAGLFFVGYGFGSCEERRIPEYLQ